MVYNDTSNNINFGFVSKFIQIDNNIIYTYIGKADKKRLFINEIGIESKLRKKIFVGQFFIGNRIELIKISLMNAVN